MQRKYDFNWNEILIANTNIFSAIIYWIIITKKRIIKKYK